MIVPARCILFTGLIVCNGTLFGSAIGLSNQSLQIESVLERLAPAFWNPAKSVVDTPRVVLCARGQQQKRGSANSQQQLKLAIRSHLGGRLNSGEVDRGLAAGLVDLDVLGKDALGKDSVLAGSAFQAGSPPASVSMRLVAGAKQTDASCLFQNSKYQQHRTVSRVKSQTQSDLDLLRLATPLSSGDLPDSLGSISSRQRGREADRNLEPLTEVVQNAKPTSAQYLQQAVISKTTPLRKSRLVFVERSPRKQMQQLQSNHVKQHAARYVGPRPRSVIALQVDQFLIEASDGQNVTLPQSPSLSAEYRVFVQRAPSPMRSETCRSNVALDALATRHEPLHFCQKAKVRDLIRLGFRQPHVVKLGASVHQHCVPIATADSLLFNDVMPVQRRLYFDRFNPGTHGLTCSVRLQPLAAGAHFFGTPLTVRYHLGNQLSHDCIYTARPKPNRYVTRGISGRDGFCLSRRWRPVPLTVSVSPSQ